MCLYGTKSNKPKKRGNNPNIVTFKKDFSETKILRYLKIMISKFCYAGHLILVFIRIILPPPELFELS